MEIWQTGYLYTFFPDSSRVCGKPKRTLHLLIERRSLIKGKGVDFTVVEKQMIVQHAFWKRYTSQKCKRWEFDMNVVCLPNHDEQHQSMGYTPFKNTLYCVKWRLLADKCAYQSRLSQLNTEKGKTNRYVSVKFVVKTKRDFQYVPSSFYYTWRSQTILFLSLKKDI